jgi:WD40 repeat protein
VASGNALQTLVGHTQAATSLAFSPDGATLASIGYDQGVWLWGVPTK